jgi:hypothetical protein
LQCRAAGGSSCTARGGGGLHGNSTGPANGSGAQRRRAGGGADGRGGGGGGGGGWRRRRGRQEAQARGQGQRAGPAQEEAGGGRISQGAEELDTRQGHGVDQMIEGLCCQSAVARTSADWGNTAALWWSLSFRHGTAWYFSCSECCMCLLTFKVDSFGCALDMEIACAVVHHRPVLINIRAAVCLVLQAAQHSVCELMADRTWRGKQHYALPALLTYLSHYKQLTCAGRQP